MISLFKKYLLALVMLLIVGMPSAFAEVKGIYLTQSTLEDTNRLNYLINQSKKVGINTFVIDLNKVTQKYRDNIQLVKNKGIEYVVRIVMFPGGGLDSQIKSLPYREQKYALIKAAIDMGTDAVQLDYIRYRPTQTPSDQNAKNIKQVIDWFKTRLDKQDIPLEIDVFGISSFKPSRYIGQNIPLFANSIDALCPMLYPSHFEPYKQHAVTPYQTIYHSLISIKKQLNNQVPFKIYAYIELSNYRYKHASQNRLAYIQAQIKAIQDAKIDGWYAWSANNYYDRLFQLLALNPNQRPQFNASLERPKLVNNE